MRMPSPLTAPISRLHICLRAAVLHLCSAYSMTLKCQAQYLNRTLIRFPSKTSSTRIENKHADFH